MQIQRKNERHTETNLYRSNRHPLTVLASGLCRCGQEIPFTDDESDDPDATLEVLPLVRPIADSSRPETFLVATVPWFLRRERGGE